MPFDLDAREQLIAYGSRIVSAGICAGTGGNISAREGSVIWMKPAGFAMDELTFKNLCGLDVSTGEQCSGNSTPTSEFKLHLAVYRNRPEVNSVFHTHPPWLTGIISAGVPFRMLTIESVGYLGRIIHLPYVHPQSDALANQVGEASREHETMLLPNHGIVTLGHTIREAYHRSLVAEDTAKTMLAASVFGRPQYLSESQISEIRNA